MQFSLEKASQVRRDYVSLVVCIFAAYCHRDVAFPVHSKLFVRGKVVAKRCPEAKTTAEVTQRPRDYEVSEEAGLHGHLRAMD